MDEFDYNYDSFAGKLFCLYLSLNLLNGFLNLFLVNNSGTNYLQYFFVFLFQSYLLVWGKDYIARIIKRIIIWDIFFLIIMFLGYLFGEMNLGELLVRFIWLYAYGIPLLSVFSFVRHTEKIIESCKKIVYISSVVSILTIMFAMIRGGIKGSYSMYLGYALLFPTILMTYLTIHYRKMLYLMMLIINLFVVLSYGSRGQLLCIFIFLTFFLFFYDKKLTPQKTIIILFSILLASVCILYFKEIILLLTRLLNNIGINSRTLTIFGEKLSYTGRESTWGPALSLIFEKPLVGWTVGVDITRPGGYPHNIFLEFLLHYGCILGGIGSLGIISIVFRDFFSRRKMDIVVLMLFCYGFVPLIISSEYIAWPSFWAFLGLSYSKLKNESDIVISILREE